MVVTSLSDTEHQGPGYLQDPVDEAAILRAKELEAKRAPVEEAKVAALMRVAHLARIKGSTNGS